jgi:hypothetical protein
VTKAGGTEFVPPARRVAVVSMKRDWATVFSAGR